MSGICSEHQRAVPGCPRCNHKPMAVCVYAVDVEPRTTYPPTWRLTSTPSREEQLLEEIRDEVRALVAELRKGKGRRKR